MQHLHFALSFGIFSAPSKNGALARALSPAPLKSNER